MKKFTFSLMLVACMLLNINITNASTKPGEIVLNKYADKDDITYGRDANVTLEVSANPFTTMSKKDVVLVLDRSKSMNGEKMESVKSAAIDLIDTLLAGDNKKGINVGIVTYGYDYLEEYSTSKLTNNKDELKKIVNEIPVLFGHRGTNIHMGLYHADKLLNGSTNERIIILLSDGIPTYYQGNNNTRCSEGRDDDEDLREVCQVNIGNTLANRPSEAAIAYSNTIKGRNQIYTIGFKLDNEDRAVKILNSISSNPDSKYSYRANNYNDLKATFNSIFKDINLVAKNGIVTDQVPIGFEAIKESFNKEVAIKNNDDGTSTITWNIGDIKSTDVHKLTYKVKAKKNHYGSMYTNVLAELNAIKIDGNPAYASDKLTLEFPVPDVPIPPVTNDDNYASDDKYDMLQGTELTVGKVNGILSNDELAHKHLDENALVNDKIIITEGNINDIVINKDGSFTYTPSDKNKVGLVQYKYYIETEVNKDGNITIVKSNTSTITINIVPKKTTYIVKYLEKNTNNKLLNNKIGSGDISSTVTENYVNINGYDLVSNKTQSIILDKDHNKNVIVFYYEKKHNLQYEVNYLEKDTNKVLHDKKIVENQNLGKKINSKNEIIEIDGYKYDHVNIEELTIKENGNIINIYYTPLYGKVIVHYVDDFGKTLLDDTSFNGQVGDNYKTIPKDIEDYALIDVKGNETGKYINDTIEVTYVYQYVMGQGGDDPEVPETPDKPETPENPNNIPQTGANDYTNIMTLLSMLFITLYVRKKVNE